MQASSIGGSAETALTAHLVKPELANDDRFLSDVACELHDRFGIEHATLQIETGDPAHPCPMAPEHAV